MDSRWIDWLGWRPLEVNHTLGAWNPTIYSLLALAIYVIGFLAFGWSAIKVWRDKRAAYKQPDKKIRIVANGNWRSTFYRLWTMILLVLLGILGTTSSDVSALPTNIRRAVGLILLILIIGLFCNAERFTWRTRRRLNDYIESEESK